MSVSITSRYRQAAVYPAVDATGSTRATVAIRRYTPPAAGDITYEHRVTGVEDIEYLSWRYFGDSQVWWRIADANPVAFPLDLRPGAALSVPASQDIGQVSRDRVF
ncbi:hypothetical protein ACFYW8_14990 [Streptomyces sp. NPDC002742]|jgi:hypothetical protein|uniref:hypothetical protein n=1 Tax=Streptomyces sp. NPDC002742 TaxID=3364663 RepID=UPI003684085D